MTPSQLGRLAELVNAKWPEMEMRSTVFPSGAEGWESMVWDYSPTSSDFHNAEFIIWAWDRLIELGKDPAVGKRYKDWSVVPNSYDWDCPLDFYEGDTRAQAFALALLEALESEP